MDSQNWVMKSLDMDNKYKTVGRNPKIISKGILGLRNMIWPGWTTLAYEGKHSSIYIGYGHKAKQNYFPREPETILNECADR